MNIMGILSELRLYICNEWISVIPSHGIRVWYYRHVMGFKIGRHSTAFMHCSFDCARGLTVGYFSFINARCRLDPRGGITIGNNVSISADVIILTADHEKNEDGDHNRERPVVIEDEVWIGTRAMILPGVRIGKGAKIAAGSVVTKDVPSMNVYGGIPARFMKMKEEVFCDEKDAKPYKRLFQ